MADKLMRFRMAEKASEQLGWPLYPIDDCGHGPHIERPDVFVRRSRPPPHPQDGIREAAARRRASLMLS
jgi:pimeloyl-ACP methyl ester carboxylesterase